MAYRDGEAPEHNLVVYRNADTRFSFDQGYTDENDVYTIDPETLNNAYQLVITGPGTVYSDYVYGTAFDLPNVDGEIGIHLSAEFTAQLIPHKKYNYRVDEIVPSGDKYPILVGDLFVRSGA